MGSLTDLRTKAIAAAKNNEWQTAADANQEIIAINPSDITALNRLGMALLQLGNTEQARDAFNTVVRLDATNAIARKQLERIEKHEQIAPPQFSKTQFIEEPGKSKICQLHRLAGRNVLELLRNGQSCMLKPKSRYISVETEDNHYIGSLPDDVSFRLSQLITGGNRYECVVYTVTKTDCAVFIRESYRSPENQQFNSFPLGGSHPTSTEGETEDSYLLLEDEEGEGGVKSDPDDDEESEEAEDYSNQDRYTHEDIDRLQ